METTLVGSTHTDDLNAPVKSIVKTIHYGTMLRKNENNYLERKIDLSKRPLCDILDISKGLQTMDCMFSQRPEFLS